MLALKFGGRRLAPLGPHHILVGSMSELMGDVHAESKPGTALKVMMREHAYLDKFLAMVKAKMELDEKHLSELKTLRDSWDPDWDGLGFSPLVAPFLTYLGDEIAEREKAATELNSRFFDLPNHPFPSALHKDGFYPTSLLKDVQLRYQEYEKAHQVISTPESINELQNWRHEVTSAATQGVAANETAKLGQRVLPRREREYRRAVVTQRTVAKQVIKWQRDDLPDILERHQQRAEDVKSFLNLLFNIHVTHNAVKTLNPIVAAMYNRIFRPFIVPRHEEREEESSHASLQVVDYRNYMLGGEVTRPLFGLGVQKTLWLLNQLLEQNTFYLIDFTHHESWMDPAFELEKEAARTKLPAVLESFTTQKRMRLCMHALLDTPLLPLSGNIVAWYQNGMARWTLSLLLKNHLLLARQEVLTLAMRLVDGLRTENSLVPKKSVLEIIATHLCHNSGAAGIVESIWRKWDVDNDRPLPKEVERVWDVKQKKAQALWKTGDIYYPLVSSSSG